MPSSPVGTHLLDESILFNQVRLSWMNLELSLRLKNSILDQALEFQEERDLALSDFFQGFTH